MADPPPGPRFVTSTSPPPIAREIRAEAQRQARGLPSAMLLVGGTLVAVVGVAVIVLLDYQFGQAPHRLIKLLLGVTIMTWIVLQPRVGLLTIPVATPFLPWVPPIPVPGVNALNVLLGTVFASWTLGRVFRREPVLRPGRLTWPIAGLVLIIGLSVIRGAAFPTGYTYEAGLAAVHLFRAAIMFATYFIALSIARGERDRRMLTWAIVIGLLAEAVVTVIYGRSGRGGRAVGSIGQSNDLGTFLAMYTAFAIAFLPAVRNWFGRLILLAAVAAGGFASILSLSRGALLALGVALLYVGFRSSRALMLMLLLVTISSPLWAPDYLKDRFMGTQVEVEGVDDAELDNASQVRVDTWRAIVTIVTDHPLDGVGFTGLAYILPATGDALGVEVKDSSHNSFLRCLGEMGILGFGLFLILLWACWRLGGAARKAADRPFDRQLGVGLEAMTIALIISCLFGDRFFNVLIMGNYWVACALANDLVLERRAQVAEQAAAARRERAGLTPYATPAPGPLTPRPAP